MKVLKGSLRILKNKWVKWTGLAVAGLLLAGFALSIIFFQPWLRNKLQTEVKEKSDGIYSLHMRDLSASLMGGTLTIDSFALVPDSAAWLRLHRESHPGLTSRLTDLTASRVKLTGINYLGLLFKKPFDLGKVHLTEPVLHLNQMKEDTSGSEPLHRGLEGPMENMRIKKVRIENGTFSYKKDYRHKYNTAEGSGLDLEVNDILLDSAAYKAEDRIYYARKLVFSAGKTNVLMPAEASRVRTGVVTVDSESRQIKIENLEFSPVYKPAALARFKGEASTWLDLKVPEVVLTEVDLGGGARNGSVAVGEIALLRPRLKAFKDKQNFSPKTDRALPHHLVQKFPAGLHIGKVTISNMQVRYDELAEDAKTTGHISLSNLNATITNISNHKNRITAQDPAVAKVNFSFLGKGRMDCTIRMPLLDPDCAHTVSGKFTDTDLTVFNSILEPAYFVGFKSGTVHNAAFNLNLNCNTATGKMEAKYTNLQIDLLSKDEERKQSLPKKALSKIANKVVVKEDNLPEDDGLRTAEIKVTRQKKRSVFTYWKDCLEQGLLISAGLEKFQPSK